MTIVALLVWVVTSLQFVPPHLEYFVELPLNEPITNKYNSLPFLEFVIICNPQPPPYLLLQFPFDLTHLPKQYVEGFQLSCPMAMQHAQAMHLICSILIHSSCGGSSELLNKWLLVHFIAIFSSLGKVLSTHFDYPV